MGIRLARRSQPRGRASLRARRSARRAHGRSPRTTRFETRLQRLELKYLIDEPTADRIRGEIELYCEPDEHNPARSARYQRPDPLGYEIYSLYLDSPSLAFYRAKMRGDPERLKLRIRTYSARSPALLEIKRRVADVIDKTRVMVDRKQAEEAVAGLAAPLEDGPQARRSLNEFSRIAAESGAGPALYVHYTREAYTSLVDDYARVCFDRHIGVQRTESWELDPDPYEWCEFDHYWRPELADRSVVLELKCQSTIPPWLSDLVRRHSLDRTSFSKYSTGIHLTRRVNGERKPPKRDARVMV
jgi:SPX domain protein involved in polyphosphate accumulation